MDYTEPDFELYESYVELKTGFLRIKFTITSSFRKAFTSSKQELEDVLMKRNEDLLPSEAICRELALLCNRVTSALEALMIDPTPGTPGIEDVKVVGSFKKGEKYNFDYNF